MRWFVKVVQSLPNLLTLTNVILGCIAIVYIMESAQLFVIKDIIRGKIEVKPSSTEWGMIIQASWLVWIALIIDYLDGMLARILKATSELGRMLDMLADLIVFGVVPSLILYRLIASVYRLESVIPPGSDILFMFAFVFAGAVAYRLARFNAEKQDQTTYWFEGLPAPAGTLFVISYFYLLLFEPEIRDIIYSPASMYIFTFTVSILMVSRFRMLSLKLGVKELPKRIRLTRILLLILAAAGTVLWLLSGRSLWGIPFVLSVAYLLSSIANHLATFQLVKSKSYAQQ